ncbi:MAG TPA: serine/threonine-protein kinase [Caldimonas sp.]|nr:serine/threonine-protein kinase [Caldimonas sp.]
MSSSPPPSVPSSDSEPAPLPTIPGVGLWSDSDPPAVPVTPPVAFSGLVATPADRAMPTIGHIGRYALKYQLGEGGLGTVFAAHDPLLSRLIAVKTLNVKVPEAERESFNALFLNEARAAGGLSHPHIVTVFDAGISDERAYIAMELLKGRDLRQLRQEGWRATPAQAALIIRRVADALAFAHSKGVIHRDIKPANIFMVGRTQPRVLDFGIARVAHQQESNDPHSGAGSPYYMAPEQVRRELSDRRADVFSLGVVFYELLTDVKPFRGESLAQIRDAVLNHEPPLANKVDSAVPKALAAIAARAMAKDPEHRFRSARSLARELRQWLDDNPVNADGEKTAPFEAQPVKPSGLVLGAVVAAGIAAVTAAIATWVVLVPSTPALADAAPAPVEARTMGAATRAEGEPSTLASSESATTGGMLAAPQSPSAAEIAATIAPAVDTAPAIPPTLTPPAPTPTTAPIGAAPAATTVKAAAAVPVMPAPPTAPRESAKDRKAREGREREARENDARVAAAARLVAPATGTVRIAISPWGLVEVDGASSGAAPPITELTLAEGRHQIVVRNGDYAPYTASINVTAGQTISVRHKFGS